MMTDIKRLEKQNKDGLQDPKAVLAKASISAAKSARKYQLKGLKLDKSK